MHEFHIVSWCLTDAAHRWSEEATAEHTENVLKENPQMSLGAELEGVHAPIHEIGSAAPFQPWHAQSADRDQPVPYEERDWESERERERESHTSHTPTHLHRLFYISGHENWDSSEPAGWEFPEIGSGRPRSGFALPDAQEDVRFL